MPYEPRDLKNKRPGEKFRGLRGPVERAILRVSEDVRNSERWQELLSILAETQTRIDQNKEWRGKYGALPLLDQEWFQRAWPESDRPDEIVLASSIASVGAGTDHPLMVNTFGVKFEHHRSTFTKGDRPPRVVWNEGQPLRVLTQLLMRRLVDSEKLAVRPGGGLDPNYFIGTKSSLPQLAARFVAGEIDVELMARWIPALSLVNWGAMEPKELPALACTTGETAIHALFRPIFHPRLNKVLDWLPVEVESQAKPATARRIVALLQSGNLESATAAAGAFYRSLGRSVVEVTVPATTDPDFCERIAASMLIPVSESSIRSGVNRWLIPLKRETM